MQQLPLPEMRQSRGRASRWSQASERVLGTNERVLTQLFNGYAEFVAHLYEDLEGERLFA